MVRRVILLAQHGQTFRYTHVESGMSRRDRTGEILMGKALLGLLAGIALTIFVLLVLDAQPNNALSEVDEISSLRSLPGDATEDVPKRSSQGSTRDDEEQSNGVGQSNVSVIDDSP